MFGRDRAARNSRRSSCGTPRRTTESPERSGTAEDEDQATSWGTLSGHEDYPHIKQKSTLSLVDLDMGLLGSQELLDRCRRDVSRPFR